MASAETPGFLAERLAAASAVPAEQRSADVRAFIETCRLQEELQAELALPEALRVGDVPPAALHQWTPARALKLVRSHFVSLAGPIGYCPQLHLFATNIIYHAATAFGGAPPTCVELEGRPWPETWVEMLEADPCLGKFAALGAGIPSASVTGNWGRGVCGRSAAVCAGGHTCRPWGVCGWKEKLLQHTEPLLSAGAVKMCNRVVALMRRPDVRRALRAELAALPEALLSYEELLAFFVDNGSQVALNEVTESASRSGSLRAAAASSSELFTADILTALQLAMELLPRLAPDNARLRQRAAAFDRALSPNYAATMPAALEVARREGSDYFVALCGYYMASALKDWADAAAARPGVPRPSVVLGWLREAEEAHRRCRPLLPKRWTRELEGLPALAVSAKATLARLQRQGDSWGGLGSAECREVDAAAVAYIDLHLDVDATRGKFLCSGCVRTAAQLRVCGGCKAAQYCSVECQRAHWRQHKARCKEVQAASAAAPAGAASGSGSGSG